MPVSRLAIAIALATISLFVATMATMIGWSIVAPAVPEVPVEQQRAILDAMQGHLVTGESYTFPGEQLEPIPWRPASPGEGQGLPSAFVIYHDRAESSWEVMGRMFARQLAGNFGHGVLLAAVLQCVAGFRRRVGVALAVGAIAWVSVAYPQWNWWRFPDVLTVVELTEVLLSSLTAGVVVAYWLDVCERDGKRESAIPTPVLDRR